MAKHAPTRDEVQNSRLLRPFGHRIRHSELWRFTRRSVPRGVAIGTTEVLKGDVAKAICAYA